MIFGPKKVCFEFGGLNIAKLIYYLVFWTGKVYVQLTCCQRQQIFQDFCKQKPLAVYLILPPVLSCLASLLIPDPWFACHGSPGRYCEGAALVSEDCEPRIKIPPIHQNTRHQTHKALFQHEQLPRPEVPFSFPILSFHFPTAHLLSIVLFLRMFPRHQFRVHVPPPPQPLVLCGPSGSGTY